MVAFFALLPSARRALFLTADIKVPAGAKKLPNGLKCVYAQNPCTDESQDDLGRNRKLPTELLAAARPRSRAVTVLKHREPLRSEMGETYDM